MDDIEKKARNNGKFRNVSPCRIRITNKTAINDIFFEPETL